MAYIDLSGIKSIIADFEELAKIPDCVAQEILSGQADIVLKAQNDTGEAMGVHRTGRTLNSLRKGKFGRFANGDAAIKVIFKGENADGNRNAEVAYINEFGKTNQPARPFILTANEKSGAATIMVAFNVWDKYLKSKNF